MSPWASHGRMPELVILSISNFGQMTRWGPVASDDARIAQPLRRHGAVGHRRASALAAARGPGQGVRHSAGRLRDLAGLLQPADHGQGRSSRFLIARRREPDARSRLWNDGKRSGRGDAARVAARAPAGGSSLPDRPVRRWLRPIVRPLAASVAGDAGMDGAARGVYRSGFQQLGGSLRIPRAPARHHPLLRGQDARRTRGRRSAIRRPHSRLFCRSRRRSPATMSPSAVRSPTMPLSSEVNSIVAERRARDRRASRRGGANRAGGNDGPSKPPFGCGLALERGPSPTRPLAGLPRARFWRDRGRRRTGPPARRPGRGGDQDRERGLSGWLASDREWESDFGQLRGRQPEQEESRAESARPTRQGLVPAVGEGG